MFDQIAFRLKACTCGVLGACIAASAWAQDLPPRNTPPPETGLLGFFTHRTPYEFWLTTLIVLFGLAVIVAILFFFRRSADNHGDRVVRALVVVVIVVGTLVLITAGYSNEQVAPAFGLFGTIVGYFLGRLSSTPADQPASATASTTGTPTTPKQGQPG